MHIGQTSLSVNLKKNLASINEEHTLTSVHDGYHKLAGDAVARIVDGFIFHGMDSVHKLSWLVRRQHDRSFAAVVNKRWRVPRHCRCAFIVVRFNVQVFGTVQNFRRGPI